MLVAYFDESGHDERSLSFWLAGFVARQTEWYGLSRRWRSFLRNRDISAFHMTAFESRRGAFDPSVFPEEDRIPLISGLTDIIEDFELHGVASGIVRTAYDETVNRPGVLADTFRTPSWWKTPYVLSFQHAIVEACHLVDGLEPSERLHFVFGQHREFGGRAQLVYQQLSADSRWDNHNRLGSVEFLDNECRPGLQVADILAFELRKGLDNRLCGSPRAERVLMSRLKGRVRTAPYFDAASLQALLSEFTPAT